MYTFFHVIATILSVPFWVIGFILTFAGFSGKDNIGRIARETDIKESAVSLICWTVGPMLLVIAWFMVTL